MTALQQGKRLNVKDWLVNTGLGRLVIWIITVIILIVVDIFFFIIIKALDLKCLQAYL